MITIAKIVEKIIRKSPFLEESLADGIINISSYARKIKPEVEEALRKEVKEGAIVMAINRLSPSSYLKVNKAMTKLFAQLGDINVRSGLSDFTFKNSETIIERQAQLLHHAGKDKNLFCTYSQGVNETTIVVSSGFDEFVSDLFKEEVLFSYQKNLASITLKLPKSNVEISGIYYFILKKLAWENINIVEVISTTNEFTIVVNDADIDASFALLRQMRH